MEAGGQQRVRGSLGGIGVQVGQQNCGADSDAAGDGLADGAGADDDRNLRWSGCAHVTSFSSWANDRSWLSGAFGLPKPFRLWSRLFGAGSPCCSGVCQDPPRPHRRPDSAAMLGGMGADRLASSGGTELGQFLRARRAQITPAEVGLPTHQGLRRTPGLRREELATLAGISSDYYVRLERGKETRPSAQVIDALARALRLDSDEHDHLRSLAALASRRPSEPPPMPTRSVPPGVAVLLGRMRPHA